MTIAQAIEEVAYACQQKSESLDYSDESRPEWNDFKNELERLANRVVAREEADSFHFSDKVAA